MKKPASDLKLDGRWLDLGQSSAVMLAIKKHLDGCPHDELYTSHNLHEKGVAGLHVIQYFAHDGQFPEYCHRQHPKGQGYYGHPKAIELLRKKLAERVR